MKEFVISEAKVETAVLVGLITQTQDERKTNEYLDELAFLAETAGAEVVKRFTQKLPTANSVTYVGKGKLEEIKEYIRIEAEEDREVGMVIFDEADVDLLVLETGLGGRLDATNSIVSPLACVITSISLDHVEYLGDTIEKIAGEKAGIIKPGVPVIFDGNQEEAEKVIKNRAKELGCPYYEVKQASQKMTSYTPDGISFTYDSKIYGTIDLFIPFIAKYQMMNASLAVETMGVLKEVHKIEKETLKAGMEHTKWQGRMETVLPGVIVDGAHNEDGIAKFVETVRYFQDDYPITLLFTTVSDKDFKDMIQKICNGLHFSNVYVTEIWGSRKQSSTELAELFRENGCKQVYAEPDCEKAFELAYAKKGDGLLFVVGSLYLVGEIKDYLKRRNK